MEPYKSQSRKIRDAVITTMQALQFNGEDAFVQVTGSTSGEFEGYPALRVLPNDLQDVKGTVSQNDRTAEFMLLVHIPLEDGTTQQNAIDKMLDYGDLIMNNVDDGDWHDSLNQIDNTLGILRLDTKQIQWEVLNLKSGAVLLCRVDISIMYSRNNQ